MDRAQKRELRKRGAATRDFATGDIRMESPIKKPNKTKAGNWGILESNVLLDVPATQPQPDVAIEGIRNDSYYNDYGDDVDNDDVNDDVDNDVVDMVDVVDVVDVVDSSKAARKALEIVSKSKKKRASKTPSKKTKPKVAPVESPVESSEPIPKPKKKKEKSMKDIAESKPKKQKELTHKVTKPQSNKSKVKPQKPALKNTYVSPTEIDPTMKITRLPTSSSRLTSIDILLHYLRSLTPQAQKVKTIDHFEIFHQFNEDYFLKTLDLNLVNNDYIYKLKQIKREKAELRQRLYEIKDNISEKMSQLEALRHKYTTLKNKIKLNRKLEENMKSLGQVEVDIRAKFSKLNTVLDPNFGLFEKLKLVNEKLQLLDRELHSQFH